MFYFDTFTDVGCQWNKSFHERVERLPVSDFTDFTFKVAWCYLYSAIFDVILLIIGSFYKTQWCTEKRTLYILIGFI